MSDMRDLTEKLRDNRDGVNFNLRLEAAAEIDDLRKSNTLLHGFVTNRDAEIARLSAAKTAALKLADERAKEAVELRAKLASARKALEAAKEFADDEFSDCGDLNRKNRISRLCDTIDAALTSAYRGDET